MSTSINQIIEVRKDGKWQYVPLALNRNESNDTLQHCGSVRDLFAYKWYDADDYLKHGVPEDISKEAREAMIYDTDDYIKSGAVWISSAQFEALGEHIRQKYMSYIDKLSEAKMKSGISERLSRLENLILGKNSIEPIDDDSEYDEQYIAEELEDLMWCVINLEKNWAEIEAYVNYFTSGEYAIDDIRVIMFVS